MRAPSVSSSSSPSLRLLRKTGSDILAAVQFLTRIPVPAPAYESDALSRAVKFFPVVGLLLGGAAALLHLLLAPHLPRLITAILVIAFLILITGCFHEDGLADAADGFGGGWTREQVLMILKDSRIGSYGGVALIFSVLGRVLLIASLPLNQVPPYLIAAHVLSRWTTLPLSYYLPPARVPEQEAGVGQGQAHHAWNLDCGLRLQPGYLRHRVANPRGFSHLRSTPGLTGERPLLPAKDQRGNRRLLRCHQPTD